MIKTDLSWLISYFPATYICMVNEMKIKQAIVREGNR